MSWRWTTLGCVALNACTYLVSPPDQVSPLAASTIQLSSEVLYEGQAITASAVPVSRKDGQVPAHSFEWTLDDGAPCPGATGRYDGETLPAQATCTDQVWRVTVVPRIGDNFVGPAAEAMAPTVRAKPAAPSIVLVPASPYDSEDVYVVAQQQPPDPNVSYLYAWQAMGDPCQATTFTSQPLPSGLTCPGQTWQVTVTPVVAGGVTGTSAQSTIQPVRPLPAAPELSLQTPLEQVDLPLSIDGPSDLGDGRVASYACEWTRIVDGGCTPADASDEHAGCTLPKTKTCAGQRWRVQVDTTFSTNLPSSLATLTGNSAMGEWTIAAMPPLPNLSVSPQFPTECSGALVGSRIGGTSSWLVNGELLPVTYQQSWIKPDGTTVPGTVVSAGDVSYEIPGVCNAGECAYRFQVTQTVGPHQRDPVSISVTVGNEGPPTRLAGLNLYQPRADDVVRAYVRAEEGATDCEGDTAVPDEAAVHWFLDDVAIEACAGSSECDLEAAGASAGQQLTVRAAASDGRATALEYLQTIDLGPFPLQAENISWRQRSPSFTQNGFVVGFDQLNERFLILEGTNLFEYTKAFGFARLQPTGTPPAFSQANIATHTYAMYDGTPGQERVLWLGLNDSNQYAFYELDVTNRGREIWNQIPMVTGVGVSPDPLCFAGTYYNVAEQALVFVGGIVCGSSDADDASDQIWLFVDGGWRLGATLSRKTWGVTVLKHPVNPARGLFVGGQFKGSGGSKQPARPHALTFMRIGGVLAMAANEDLNDTLNDAPIGVTAFGDAAHGIVVGGPGWTRSEDEADAAFFRYGPAGSAQSGFSESTNAPDAADFSSLAEIQRLSNAAMGAAGVIDGEVVMAIGDSQTGASTQRLARFRLVERTYTPLGDVWEVLFSTAREMTVTGFNSAGGIDGAFARYGSNDASGHWASFDLASDRWQSGCGGLGLRCQHPVDASSNTLAAPGGGFYLVGGHYPTLALDHQMFVLRLRSAAWSTVANIVGAPPQRDLGQLFDTGCAGDTFALTGGLVGSTAEQRKVWLRRGGSWMVGPALPGGGAPAAVAYDGARYALAVSVGGFTVIDGLYVLDACESNPQWQAASGVPGSVLPTGFAQMHLVRQSPPTFLLARNLNGVILISETGDKAYNVSTVPASRPVTGALVWDATHRRMLDFGSSTGFALWELKVPEGALP